MLWAGLRIVERVPWIRRAPGGLPGSAGGFSGYIRGFSGFVGKFGWFCGSTGGLHEVPLGPPGLAEVLEPALRVPILQR